MNEYDEIAKALLFEDWEDLQESDHSIEFALAVNWLCVLHDLEPLLMYEASRQAQG